MVFRELVGFVEWALKKLKRRGKERKREEERGGEEKRKRQKTKGERRKGRFFET